MQIEQKHEIAKALKLYLNEKGLKQSAFCRSSGVTPAYVSAIMNGQYTVSANGKPVEISDYHFKKISDFLGLKLNKDYWPIQATEQLITVLAQLQDAKDNSLSGMIIGPTGSSKTQGVDLFCQKFPHHTYKLTVSNLHTLPFILEKLLSLLGQDQKGRTANKMDRIINHLKHLKYSGEKVIIIIDESENLKPAVFGMIKAMYDGIVNHASIMLIGTPEVLDKMERGKKLNKDGMPQFCRRFKANTVNLSPIEKHKDFECFFDTAGLEDKALRELLTQVADNYGELHDYLEPALKEADRRGVELTEDLFRLIYKMPKPIR